MATLEATIHKRFYLDPCPCAFEDLQNICQQINEHYLPNSSISIEFFIHNKLKNRSFNSYSIAIFNITQCQEGPEIDISSLISAQRGDIEDDEKEFDDNKCDNSVLNSLLGQIFPIFHELSIQLKNIQIDDNYQFLNENEISLPSFCFRGIKSKDPLRICTSIPIQNHNRLIFQFKDEIERDKIYQTFRYFVEQKEYTHFLALPISPNFPNWNEALVQVYNRWNVNVPKAINLMHITLSLFVLKDDDEIELVNSLILEALHETEWPELCLLKFPNLGFFGSSKQAKILYIEPESNEFTNCVTKFTLSFVSKMKDHGFGYIEESTSPYHITVIRPNFLGRKMNFNCSRYLNDYNENDLPELDIQEFRLVQRFKFDEDQFYHTHYHYSIK